MSELGETLQTILDASAQDPMVPGVMAAVIAPRQSCNWLGASGRDQRQTVTPLRASQPFRIASVTKMYVAAAAHRLAEDGLLQLDSVLSTLISESLGQTLKVAGYQPDVMTVSELLCHTSGLHDHVACPDYVEAVLANPQRQWTRQDQLTLAMSMGKPLGAPGSVFRYSDTGYVLVGDIIERITGQTIGPATRDLLGLDRLGLERTWWEGLESSRDDGLPRVHQYLGDVDTVAFDPTFDLFGGGGIVSTVEDMARFSRALFRGEVFRRPGTLAAALLVPPADRLTDAFLHSSLAMVIPMSPFIGWGHSGFWGCIAASCPDRDVSVAASVNQNSPADPALLRKLVTQLVNAVAASAKQT